MARRWGNWTVVFDADAVIDLEDSKARGDRTAIFNVVQKLKDLGPARPIYARFGQDFVVLAIAATKESLDALLAEEQLANPSFRAEWQRLAPAREFAATLLRYRAAHGLSQRDLARRLGVSQPRVVKLESGEHNPDVDTIINAVRRLEIEFALDVAPANRKPALVTARATKNGAIAHDDVSVVAASTI